MTLTDKLRVHVARWPYSVLSLFAATAAFGAYTSMYSFRKAFSAGIFTGQQYLHIDYKVWLVIAQIIGYTASKFYGIKFISEVRQGDRARSIIILISIAWLALLGFALVPAPYNIIFLLVNGFPLGLMWGLIFGYLEGRRSTEFMAGVMSISLIFASGFVKTIARTLMSSFHISEFTMPFLVGGIFILPLLVFICCLELMPPPTEEDIRLRTKRLPMNALERKQFLTRFLPGIILTLVIYVLLTTMRDVRDNFEVEIWSGLGIKDNSIYTKIDSGISLLVLLAISGLILVKRNLKAFSFIHLLIIGGCLLIGAGSILFRFSLISPVTWMTLTGLGLYMGYVPYNAVFFERLLATYRYKGNVGFLMYLADATGYLGSVGVLMVKEFGRSGISWYAFFKEEVVVVAVIGGVCACLSLIYFLAAARKQQHAEIKKELTLIPA